MNPTIRLAGIRKEYRPGRFRRPVAALCGLDLAVREGETYGLIGPNGSGKTTTFRILLGLVRPDEGTGEILGSPLGDRAARRRLGYLPETPCYYPFLTVRELLRLAARLSGAAEPVPAAERALERFELGDLAGRPLRRLSKGELQRVGLAQAVVHDPPLLILDEPMSGLDPLSRALVKEWIRSLGAAGRTVVLASHVLADVEALAGRVGLIRDGRIAIEGSAEDLLRDSEVEVEVEFLLAGDPERVLEGLSVSLERRAGVWAATLATGRELEVSALLSRVLAKGGSVRSVQRRRRSLERFYVESLREGGPERRAVRGKR